MKNKDLLKIIEYLLLKIDMVEKNRQSSLNRQSKQIYKLNEACDQYEKRIDMLYAEIEATREERDDYYRKLLYYERR